MFAFVFSRKRFNRILAFCVAGWAATFVLRVTLYVVLGPEVFVMSTGHRLLIVFAGLFAGIAITMMIIKRKAVRVPKVSGGSTTSHSK